LHGYLSGVRCRLHMAQLMPLPLTVSCFSKIQIGFTFLLPAHLGSPGKRAVKWVCVCVCVCVTGCSQLEQHQKHHAGIRPHACRVCGRRFALECSRDKHMTIHSNDKPLMCDTCGQRFAHISYLKSHQRTHRHERPYSCQARTAATNIDFGI